MTAFFLILAFTLGGLFGICLMALCSIAKRADRGLPGNEGGENG